MENAVKLLDAAENARQSGHGVSEMTILISAAGAIRMVANSDWPLDSLQAHHGAATAYRVTKDEEKLRIDGREGLRSCRFESADTHQTTRLILGSRTRAELDYAAIGDDGLTGSPQCIGCQKQNRCGDVVYGGQPAEWSHSLAFIEG